MNKNQLINYNQTQWQYHRPPHVAFLIAVIESAYHGIRYNQIIILNNRLTLVNTIKRVLFTEQIVDEITNAGHRTKENMKAQNMVTLIFDSMTA